MELVWPLDCLGRYYNRRLLHLLHVCVSHFYRTKSVVGWMLTNHSCITARRRRSRNMAPYRGTGWAAGRPAGHGPAQYTGGAQPYYNNQQQPAPPYSAASQQGYYGNQGNQGYFGGGQQNGVELQQPQSSYQPQAGGDPVYNPPAGPPPGKQNDGIIR
jgi:hypothetical protein